MTIDPEPLPRWEVPAPVAEMIELEPVDGSNVAALHCWECARRSGHGSPTSTWLKEGSR
jgi:hypothetical protein